MLTSMLFLPVFDILSDSLVEFTAWSVFVEAAVEEV